MMDILVKKDDGDKSEEAKKKENSKVMKKICLFSLLTYKEQNWNLQLNIT